MSAPVTIRRFRSEDAEAVRAIFQHGMWGLLPQMTLDFLTRPSALLGLAVPCGSAAALHWFQAGKPALWAQAVAVLLGLGAIPLGAMALMRRAMGNYINYSLKDDLADIQKAYSEPGSAFWVAEMEGKGVVGMVGLHRRSDTVAELRRLSVKEGIRGAGIATKLCKELARHAKEQGFEGVFLVTTSAQQPALRIYWKQGWKTDKVWWGSGIKFYQLTLNLVQLETEANTTTDKQA